MRVNIFSKEQIKDLQFKINKYYEIYDEMHKWNKDKDLRDIDEETIDSIMLSLDIALRIMPCIKKETGLKEVK